MSCSRATVFRRLSDRLKALELAAVARTSEAASGSLGHKASYLSNLLSPLPSRDRDDTHAETKNFEDRMPIFRGSLLERKGSLRS